MAIFTDVWYFIRTDILDGWIRKSTLNVLTLYMDDQNTKDFFYLKSGDKRNSIEWTENFIYPLTPEFLGGQTKPKTCQSNLQTTPKVLPRLSECRFFHLAPKWKLPNWNIPSIYSVVLTNQRHFIKEEGDHGRPNHPWIYWYIQRVAKTITYFFSITVSILVAS